MPIDSLLRTPEKFFAWDIVSYILLAMVVSIIIVFIDQRYYDKGGAKKPLPKTFKGWLCFFWNVIFFLRTTRSERYRHRPKIVQLASEFFPVLFFVFILRGVIVEPFVIPSNSMMPTLLTGDFIAVNKMAYSLNVPVINRPILEYKEPQRGDVIVFRYPNYERTMNYEGADFIKRIIAVPGDLVSYQNDRLVINGRASEYLGMGRYIGQNSGKEMTGFRLVREFIGDRSYELLFPSQSHSREVFLRVPLGHYFVMGDNRARSSDSRFWGFVPREYILGKAFGIWMHFDRKFTDVRLDRIGAFE